MFPQSRVAPVGYLRAGRSHWRTLAGLASARNKRDRDTLENTCSTPAATCWCYVTGRSSRKIRENTSGSSQGPRATPPAPRPVIYLPHRGAGDEAEGAGSTTPLLYGVQPIRPRTTSDSSRNIFGHALARAEEAEGKRDAVEMGLVSSYQFENSFDSMLHRSSGMLINRFQVLALAPRGLLSPAILTTFN
ncbi:Uncharacterized protein DBV15_03163 [Temnothorax longispinosus]|uniref:Uncharacterized protein n=1 Tax=Temnothorax longispinosus TaxID=300112 RepID=A0A4S2KNU2_9HYME|nr:Uncharacterized protein DBV15_03163 [Temnothorax longispinosus]